MKRKKISEAIENINPKYIDEATEYTGAVKNNSKKVWYKWVAAAACFALVLAIGFPFAKDLLISPDQKDTVEPIIMVEYDNFSPLRKLPFSYFSSAYLLIID